MSSKWRMDYHKTKHIKNDLHGGTNNNEKTRKNNAIKRYHKRQRKITAQLVNEYS